MKKNFFLSILFFAGIGMYSCADTELNDVESHLADIQNQSTEVMEIEDVSANPQWKAIQQYEQLTSHFQSVPLGPGTVDLPFPGYYAGAYVNDDNKLVVQVKGNSDKLKQKIYDLVGSEDIVIQRAKHSMGTLNRIMNGLNEFKLNPANKAASANWNRYAISETNNEVVVGMLELNENQIKAFKKTVMNHPAIRFEQSQEIVRTVNLQPGCALGAFEDMSKGGSMAFRARLSDGTEGVIGTGHGFNVGNYAYYDSEIIGYCSDKQESGSVDAAFITVYYPDSYIPSNLICNTSSYLSTATSRPGEGTVVNMRGWATGHSSGKILNTNATVDYQDGTVLTNVVHADYSCYDGDSGGVVYTYISSTNTRYTVGVQFAAEADYQSSYYCKADLALSALDASRY